MLTASSPTHSTKANVLQVIHLGSAVCFNLIIGKFEFLGVIQNSSMVPISIFLFQIISLCYRPKSNTSNTISSVSVHSRDQSIIVIFIFTFFSEIIKNQSKTPPMKFSIKYNPQIPTTSPIHKFSNSNNYT